MSKSWFSLGFVASCLVGFTCLPAQAGFTPLFQVADVTGSCSAEPPGGAGTRALVGGEGLAYGTTLSTGPGGSLTLLLSSYSKIDVGPDAVILVTEDPANPIQKIIHLNRGKLTLDLAKDFKAENGLQLLTRCQSLNYLTGGGSTAEAAVEADLKVVMLASQGAEFSVDGPQYLIPKLRENDGITVACADDLSFIRLRDTSGKYTVRVTDSNGDEQLSEMVQDSVIKILQKASEADPSITIVTLLVIGPDGEVISASSYEAKGQPPPAVQPTQGPTTTTGGTVGGPTGTTNNLFPTTTSSSTSSTTTTTVPPGDLIPNTTAHVTTTAHPTTTTKPNITPTGRQ